MEMLKTHDLSAGAPFRRLTPRARRRILLKSLLRAVLTWVVLLVVYYLLPLEERSGLGIVLNLVAGVAVLVLVLAVNVWHIFKSDYPGLRALDATAVAVPLLLVIFASIYVQIATDQPAAFSEQISRSDALYFTVTVLSTVGFGDITPSSTPARMATMVQMLGDLVLFAIFAKVITGAIAEGRTRLSAQRLDDGSDDSADGHQEAGSGSSRTSL
jgi:hypothetical protein